LSRQKPAIESSSESAVEKKKKEEIIQQLKSRVEKELGDKVKTLEAETVKLQSENLKLKNLLFKSMYRY